MQEPTMTRVWRLFGLHKSVSAPAAAAASAPEPEAKRHKNDAHEQPVVEESAAGNEEEEGDEEREANVMSSQEEDDHEEDEEEEAGAELAECEGEEEQWMRAKAVRAGQMVVPKGQEFKQVPDTRFIVDGFKLRDLPGNCTYFLTHFHSDHYGGIGCKWNAPIYCSPITGRLLVQSLGVPRDLIRELRLNETVVIQGVRVTVFDANHCPGALLILFETSVSTTLHVGDFRWNKRILAESPRLAEFKPRQLTHLFLDTTFNNPRYDFPPQEEVIACAVELVRAVLAQHRNPLFRFGAYSIGKEKVFLAVAKALNQKIYASAEKQKLLRAYCPDMSVFVSDKDAAKLHVTGLGKSGFDGLKGLEAALGAKHDAYVGISPTGWNWARIAKKTAKERPYTVRTHGRVTVYGLPYSEHSSYTELIECVAHFQPVNITPTVHNGGHSKEAIAAQLLPFHPYMDLTRDKGTIVGLFAKSASASAPSTPAPPRRAVSEPAIKSQPKSQSNQQPSVVQKTLKMFFGAK